MSKFVTVKCLVDVALVNERVMQRNDLQRVPANVAAQYIARNPNKLQVVNDDGSVIVAAGALEEGKPPTGEETKPPAGEPKLADLNPGGSPAKSKKS